MANEFYALMSRMRNITRWSLMRNTFSENIQEHSHQVAMLAHALALIRREVLHLDGPDPDRCAVAALYHDATETLTGDMPTPIKYYNPQIKSAYKQVERIAGERLVAMLPEQLQAVFKAERIGGKKRRIFAQTQPGTCHRFDFRIFFPERGQCGTTHGVDCRLAITGFSQFFRRTVKTDPAQGVSEHLIGFIKNGFCRRECVIEITPHAHRLGALARKCEECIHLVLSFHVDKSAINIHRKLAFFNRLFSGSRG